MSKLAEYYHCQHCGSETEHGAHGCPNEEKEVDYAEAIFSVFYPHSPKSAFHPKTRERIRKIIAKAVMAADSK